MSTRVPTKRQPAGAKAPADPKPPAAPPSPPPPAADPASPSPGTGFDGDAPPDASQALGTAPPSSPQTPISSPPASQLFSTPGAADGVDAKTAQGLTELGLTAKDVGPGSPGAAAFKDAARKAADGDFAAAVDILTNAGDAAKSARIGTALQNAGKHLPDGVAKALLGSPSIINRLSANPDLQASIAKVLVPKTRTQGMQEIAAALWQDDALQPQLQALGFTSADDLAKAGEAIPHLLNAAAALAKAAQGQKGEVQEALSELGQAAEAAPQLVTKAINAVAAKLPDGVGKALLKDPQCVALLVSDPTLREALKKIASGSAGGIEDGLKALSANSDAMKAVGNALWADPPSQALFSKLGFQSGDDLAQASAALPHLLAAGDALAKGKGGDALGELAQAAELAPAPVVRAVNAVAAKLPDGIVKSLLKSPRFVNLLVTDEKLHGALKKIASGARKDLKEGFTAIAGHAEAMKAAGEALWSDDGGKGIFSKLGFQSGDDIAAAGAGLPEILQLKEDLEKKDGAAVLQDLKALATAIPDAVKAKVLSKVGAAIVACLPGGAKSSLGGLSLTPDDLAKAGPALPYLLNAAEALGKGQGAEALNQLGQAAQAAPDLVAKAVNAAAAKLPDGIARALLKSPQLVTMMVTDPTLKDSLKKLTSGTKEGLKEGLITLAANAPAMKAVGAALWADDKTQALFSKWGFQSGDDLAAAGPALGEVLQLKDDLEKKDMHAALADVKALSATLPEGVKAKVLAKLGQAISSMLPGDTKSSLGSLNITEDDLAKAGDALPHLLNAAEAFGNKKPGEALNELILAAQAAPQLVAKAINAAAGKLPDGMARALLKDPTFVGLVISDPALHDSLKKLASGTKQGLKDGLTGLAGNAPLTQALGAALWADPGSQATLTKLGLQSAGDVAAVAGNLPQVLQLQEDVSSKNGQAVLADVKALATSLPDGIKAKILGKLSQAIFAALPAQTRTSLGSLEITADDISQTSDALPHFLAAAESLGKPQVALSELAQAAKAAPQVVAKAVRVAAARLPDGFAKALLSDNDFIQTLIKDPKLHDAFRQIASGTNAGIEAGLREIAADDTAMTAAANAFWNDPAAQAELQKVGFRSADEVAHAGASLADIVQLRDDLAAKNWRAALEDLNGLVHSLPEGVKAKALGAICAELKLPPGIADVILDAGPVFKDPDVRAQMATAIAAFKGKDTRGFVAGLANTAETINAKYPDAAIGFLNALGKLPGGVGRFYSNPELNEAMIRSGARNHVWAATAKMAEGDNKGAMEELAKASETLMGYGTPIEEHLRARHPDLARHLEKHAKGRLGDKGLRATGLLFKQFVEALPPELRDEILSNAAQIAAKAGAHIIPGGSLVELPADAMDLERVLKKKKKDSVDILLRGTKIGLDVAGAVPGLNDVAGPLNTAVSVIEVAKTGLDIFKNVEQLKKQFAFGDGG